MSYLSDIQIIRHLKGKTIENIEYLYGGTNKNNEKYYYINAIIFKDGARLELSGNLDGNVSIMDYIEKN